MRWNRDNMERMSDAALLENYLDTGEAEYFGTLYNRYIQLVYGLCLRYLRSVESAEDAVMQIFEELMPRVGRYRIGEFRTYIYSVARNHCLQELRRKKIAFAPESELAFVESGDMAHLLDKRDDQRRQQRLNRCIERLPAPQRTSIRLFFLEERSYADVAEMSGYNVKSVKSYIQNGKRNLKKCIDGDLTA
ncbi:MAG: sigma-70 family RNA polymerase sigma factor [Rikenellaceae bacterium]|jgi:RNA polymerase sigma-70 factor (ECF subfamily)|nr:sigma-70 family RNA polymerase sigma factor [Rikenellaceae bacterium]